jgi:hypothetical protein
LCRELTAPEGYVVRRTAHAHVVARADAVGPVAEALRVRHTLYDYAASRPGARAMQGRAPVYALALPYGGPRVVVRHSQHGGLLAPLTGDLFAYPTRAPGELATAARLAEAGVATPPVVAFVLYPGGPRFASPHVARPLFARVDVATCEIEHARDLGEVLAHREAAEDTNAWVPAVAELLGALARAGAHHPDLNVKNVLLGRAPDGGGAAAYVLDVDRVRFLGAGSERAAAANLKRLLRSARKRRAQGLAHVPEATLAALAAYARGASRADPV